MKIGIAGAGKMGTAVAARLKSVGHDLFVWNRTESKAQAAIDLGATWCPTARDLIQQADIVICLLTNEKALDDVYLSANGLLSAPAPGKLILEMSTISPDKQSVMAEKAAKVGVKYLECPVGGSIGPAKEGKLIGFVGGSAEDLVIAKPLLEQMCKRVEHVGNHGAGSMMKLAINLPLLVYWHTFAEALSLIQPLGLDPKRVVDIFSETSGGPNLLKNRGAFIAQSLIDGKSDTVNVTLNTVIKDLNAMRTHAQTLDRKLPLTELAMANFEASAQSGLGDADAAEHLVRWLKKT
ncbi:MAG: NAD(P)-dependent oxidoreductase [Burkholderiales bacterium]|nr:NAD(P)-dependent oxidoreductase [Burkholderiales bacterium]